MSRAPSILSILLIAASLIGCTRSAVAGQEWVAPANTQVAAILPAATATRTPFMPSTHVPGTPIPTPTADPPRVLPTPRSEPTQYVVQPGDSLGRIAQRYNLPIGQLIRANQIVNANYLEVGQVLTIPVATPQAPAIDFKIIPDSELVYGPASVDFDLNAFVKSKGGYLSVYHEVVNDENLSGAQVLAQVAQEYSVNPRLLLAVLQYRSGWVLKPQPDPAFNDYPLGYFDAYHVGLYSQLSWAADSLNRGYYLWRANAISNWPLMDGSLVPASPTINAGTAGVQYLMSLFYGVGDWEQAVSQKGLFATYQSMFGYPFDYSVDPILPPDLKQPTLQLPFEPGQQWSFTGGPHGGWGSGSAWAALDFAPPGDALGCVPSAAWVVAMADGVIVSAKTGAVVEDLDGDGLVQTGWTLLYMHIATQDRVAPGTVVHAGDRIGHPSCEGGVSNGTHVHIARRYNGEWIPADGDLPFVLDGWVSSGTGVEYDGYLTKDGHSIEAWDGRRAENQIQR